MKVVLHELTHIIVVRCNDPYGIHAGMDYIRYLILIHQEGGRLTGTFIDDPDSETCLKIFRGAPSRVNLGEVKSPCPFCIANTPKLT